MEASSGEDPELEKTEFVTALPTLIDASPGDQKLGRGSSGVFCFNKNFDFDSIDTHNSKSDIHLLVGKYFWFFSKKPYIKMNLS